MPHHNPGSQSGTIPAPARPPSGVPRPGPAGQEPPPDDDGNG